MATEIKDRDGMSIGRVLTVGEALKASEGLQIKKAVARQLDVRYDGFRQSELADAQWIGRIAQDALESGSRAFVLLRWRGSMLLIPQQFSRGNEWMGDLPKILVI